MGRIVESSVNIYFLFPISDVSFLYYIYLFPNLNYVSKLQCFRYIFPKCKEPYFSLVRVWVRSGNMYRCGQVLIESFLLFKVWLLL